jgi:hypothetical protein
VGKFENSNFVKVIKKTVILIPIDWEEKSLFFLGEADGSLQPILTRPFSMIPKKYS